MVYVITDGKSYITYNEINKQTTTSKLSDAKEFDDKVKANNYAKCLKKQLQKFHWEVKCIEKKEVIEKKVKEVKDEKYKEKISKPLKTKSN